jgi:hypothetical protein
MEIEKLKELSDRELLVCIAVELKSLKESHDSYCEDVKKKVSWRTFLLIFAIMSGIIALMYREEQAISKEMYRVEQTMYTELYEAKKYIKSECY